MFIYYRVEYVDDDATCTRVSMLDINMIPVDSQYGNNVVDEEQTVRTTRVR